MSLYWHTFLKVHVYICRSISIMCAALFWRPNFLLSGNSSLFTTPKVLKSIRIFQSLEELIASHPLNRPKATQNSEDVAKVSETRSTNRDLTPQFSLALNRAVMDLQTCSKFETSHCLPCPSPSVANSSSLSLSLDFCLHILSQVICISHLCVQ